jgi:Na+/proline symporter
LQQLYYISQNTALTLVLVTSLLFAAIGIFYSRKYRGYSNYLTAGRKTGTLSLTTSLVASALGAWILFGPASAATWGGIGSVIGYSLGTAFPMIALIYLGKKIRKDFPSGITFTQFIFHKIGKNLFKFIILLSVFYMFIFLCAEITAIAKLINYISSASLWVTAALVITSTLIYTLYGGLRASILTDNFQFLIIIVLLFVCMYNIFSSDFISYKSITNKSGDLLSSKYIANYTAGLTFFIAVAATNLFHQGNWQRVFAAKNYHVLNKSLKLSFLIIIPIVFFMGITGIIAISVDSKVSPDLAFFSILLKDKTEILYMTIIILAVSLTASTIDTLVNGISSLIMVDGKKINKNLKSPNILVIFLSIIAFFIASKGFSILYLFLLADLLCCAAVFPVFYGFYKKNFKERDLIISIAIGLLLGFLLFPSHDFSKSILVGTLMPFDLFPQIVSSSLLFWSFLLATVSPAIVIMIYDSFKRR